MLMAGCGPIYHNTYENMPESNRYESLLAMTNDALCSAYNNIFVQPKTEAQIKEILTNRGIEECFAMSKRRTVIDYPTKVKIAWKNMDKSGSANDYIQFINNFDYTEQANYARIEVDKLLSESYRLALTSFDCEEADRINKQRQSVRLPGNFSLEECKSARDVAEYQPAWEIAKNENTIPAFEQFILQNPKAPQVKLAREKIYPNLASNLKVTMANMQCEEAGRINDRMIRAGFSSQYDYNKCNDNRILYQVMKNGNPQSMYLAAIKYEGADDRAKAMHVYNAIIDRFSTSEIAIKAADRLIKIKDDGSHGGNANSDKTKAPAIASHLAPLQITLQNDRILEEEIDSIKNDSLKSSYRRIAKALAGKPIAIEFLQNSDQATRDEFNINSAIDSAFGRAIEYAGRDAELLAILADDSRSIIDRLDLFYNTLNTRK